MEDRRYTSDEERFGLPKYLDKYLDKDIKDLNERQRQAESAKKEEPHGKMTGKLVIERYVDLGGAKLTKPETVPFESADGHYLNWTPAAHGLVLNYRDKIRIIPWAEIREVTVVKNELAGSRRYTCDRCDINDPDGR